MREPSHQTVKLTRGKHVSPRQGACVMELASMLAGERFDDHPRSVCPVIGMVLRSYNDGIDDARRQDLYGLAAQVVGTRNRDLRNERIERCERFFGVVPPFLASFTPGARLRAVGRAALVYGAGASNASHRRVLARIEELAAPGHGDDVGNGVERGSRREAEAPAAL